MLRTRGFIFRKTVIYTGSKEHSSTYKTALLLHLEHTISNHTCIYNQIPEDEPTGSNYVEDIKMIKN